MFARRFLLSLGIVGVSLMASAPASAALFTTTSIADTMFGPGTEANTNRGTQQQMYIGNAGGGGSESWRVLVKFSLAGLPASQTITSATLKLYVSTDELFQYGDTADVYRLLVSWVEGDGPAGGGTTGATWNSRDKGGSLANWSVGGASGAGTDRAASATATVGSADIAASVLSIDVTSDVQLWYANAAPNEGWVMQATNYNETRYVNMNPREYTELMVPTLEIEYVPEPTALSLIGLSALAMIRRRA